MGEQWAHRHHRSVIPVVKDVISGDLINPQLDKPDDPTDFCVVLQALIGREDTNGCESFQFVVCTPAWLQRELTTRSSIWGRHLLIVAQYDYDLIMTAINDLCSASAGPDWTTVGERLSRYGFWEFEDYVPAEEPSS